MEAGEKIHAPAVLAQGRNPVTQSPSGRFEEEKKSLAPDEIRNPDNAVLSVVTNIYFKH